MPLGKPITRPFAHINDVGPISQGIAVQFLLENLDLILFRVESVQKIARAKNLSLYCFTIGV